MYKIPVRKDTVLYPELSYKIYGLCYEVQNELGRFLNEKQFCDFLETLFKRENMLYVREKPLPPSFEGEAERRNIPDFIIEDTIIFDAKTKWFITKQDYYQMQRYLNSYNKNLGIIVNFRQHRIVPRRVLNPNYKVIKDQNEQTVIINQDIAPTENKFKKFQKYS